MENIVFVKELDSANSFNQANDYLAKGWKLIHVGSKFISTIDNGQAVYDTIYVVGADQKLYEEYLIQLQKDALEDF